MIRRPSQLPPADTLLTYTTLFRSGGSFAQRCKHPIKTHQTVADVRFGDVQGRRETQHIGASDQQPQPFLQCRVDHFLGATLPAFRHSHADQQTIAAWYAKHSVAFRQLRQTRLQLLKARSEEHTSELQSLMRISYAVFCLKKKKPITHDNNHN